MGAEATLAFNAGRKNSSMGDSMLMQLPLEGISNSDSVRTGKIGDAGNGTLSFGEDLTCLPGAEEGEVVAPPGHLIPQSIKNSNELFPEVSISAGSISGAASDANPAGAFVFRADIDFPGVLDGVKHCRCLAHVGVVLAWGLKCGAVMTEDVFAGPTRSSRPRRAGGLFSLPVLFPFSPNDRENPCWPPTQEFCVKCWIAISCAAINRLYGCSDLGLSRQVGKVHSAALSNLRNKIERFLLGDQTFSLSFEKIITEVKERKVSYTGEEVCQPQTLTVEQIIKGLPPVGHGGSIPILPFLQGRTKFLMENPLENLIPIEERGSTPVQSKIHIQAGDKLAVFKLLEERGIIKWTCESLAFKDERGTYLNGMFGVEKPGKLTPSGSPVLRCIMNLIPVNVILRIIEADIGFLPNAANWIPLTISVGDFIYMSQGDMQSAFYLFAIPSQWEPFMQFNYSVGGDKIGRDPSQRFRPTCMVLPMGWSSSVGVMQQLSRQILLNSGLPPENELAKGIPLPLWFSQAIAESSSTRAWWQVYLGNFMSGEVTEQEPGINQTLQELAMKAWGSNGVLTAEDKQVLSSPEVVELGIRLDGRNGLLGASVERVFKTIMASIAVLENRSWSKKLCQVILGRWIFILQFRRAGMGVLSRSWTTLEHPWPTQKHISVVKSEIMSLMCLAPLLQCDLRTEYDGDVTCSDASESGGASAVSTSLGWSGNSLASSWVDPQAKPIFQPILLISFFNGIGGAFRIYDVLGVAVAGRISVDISKPANRVCRSVWPDVLEYHDILDISLATIKGWANTFNRVVEVHILAGFPCVHLSRVRAFRQNLQGAGSDLFWVLIDCIKMIQDVFQSFAAVKFCIENVASMDASARTEISQMLNITPIKLDPSDVLPFNRPRLAWCSVELHSMEGLELWDEDDFVRAYISGPPVTTGAWIRPGWTWELESPSNKFPTFMKSIKRQTPPPYPAGMDKCTPETLRRWREDCFRFPPYQYADRFLLTNSAGQTRVLDSSEREILLGFGPGHTSSCLSASAAKKSKEDYEDIRKSLCGDSFAIVSFAVMGAAMCQELMPRMSPSQIILRLGLAPGASAHPSIQVPMTRRLTYTSEDAYRLHHPSTLVRLLGLQVNHTGADVRLQTGLSMGHKVPHHGSVRCWWWQWKHLFKVKWQTHSHINFLEMKMILNTLLWKARDPQKVGKRWLHLEDSMVCLYILSKGRTSSRLLQPICNQIGALQLGLGVMVLHAHVPSEENPTDAASRAWWSVIFLVSFWLHGLNVNVNSGGLGFVFEIFL